MLRRTPSPPVVASPPLLVWGDSTNPGQTPPGCCTAAAEEEEGEEGEDGLGVRDQSAKRFHQQQLARVCSPLALATAGSEVNPGLTEISRLSRLSMIWIRTELRGRRGSRYLSGGLDQRCGAQTAAASGPLRPLQQDPGSGNVAPRHPQARLHLPAAAPRHVVGNLKRAPPFTMK